MVQWKIGVSPIGSFPNKYHFPLNHDYGRKSIVAGGGSGWSLFSHGIFALSSQESATKTHFRSQTLTKNETKTSWWFWHPFETYAQVKLDHFPSYRGEHHKYLKPPPKLDKNTCQIGSFSQNQRETTNSLNLSSRFSMTKKPKKKSKQTVAFTLLEKLNNAWRTHNSTQNWLYRSFFLSLPMVCFGRHALKEIT